MRAHRSRSAGRGLGDLGLGDFGRGEQFEPAFLAIAPNNKIPATVDRRPQAGGLTLFGSGAILTYRAELSGQLGGEPGVGRWLQKVPYLAGETYTIAAVAAYPWAHETVGTLQPALGPA